MKLPSLAMVLVAACSSHPATQPRDLAPAKAAVPSWSRDIAPVLEQQCASAKECHGDDMSIEVTLDLRHAHSYASLVGVPSEERKGAMRVAPGKPGESYLVVKLLGEQGPKEGKKMPLDPVTGLSATRTSVDRGYVQYILEPWIEAGAPNN